MEHDVDSRRSGRSVVGRSRVLRVVHMCSGTSKAKLGQVISRSLQNLLSYRH